MSTNPTKRIEEIDRRLEELPKGTLTYKKIKGKEQPYIQRTIDGKSVSYYVKVSEREQVFMEFEERTKLQEEKKHLTAYVEGLKDILKHNPYLSAQVVIGYQDFGDFTCGQQFYVDKTHFITEWLREGTKITLITRPRRFGKTTLLSTVRMFFDPRYADHPEYFDKLRVWQDERSRSMFGSTPVISTSFGGCKGIDYKQSIRGMMGQLDTMYAHHEYLLDSPRLTEEDKETFKETRWGLFHNDTGHIENSIKKLCELLYKHFGVKPIVLIDEYDTPLIEAYTDGYWDEMITTCRQLFHNTLKENDYLGRAIITGVTKVSKNSLFSDLNNLLVATVTDDIYTDCCGFTEQEVMDALKCQNIDDMKKVKEMYDGFIIGHQKDIYNPWSIVNYMHDRQLRSYWILTSSNKLIGDIICRHPYDKKYEIEQLMTGKPIHKVINENITFQYLDGDENSLWSLLLAVGYIKAENVVKDNEWTECDVSVTNKEVMSMFRTQIIAMFSNGNIAYENFTRALIRHRTWDMIGVMEDIAEYSMSYFDTAKNKGKHAPENFYHGLVLGLIVSMRKEYRIVSNRESGEGRYDIAIYPFDKTKDAYILEFKVLNEHREKTVQETAQNALKQIRTRNYESDLLAYGIPADHIYKLGFGFLGKKVWVVSDPPEKEEKDQVRSEWDNLRFR